MRTRIAYIMSRFPTITETFILFEILELERLGLEIDVFPLLRETETVRHREVEMLASHVHYGRFLSFSTFGSQIYWLLRRPGRFLRTWWRAIVGNMSSLKFLTRALVVVPLAARFAREMKALEIEHVHAHWASHPALAAYVIRQLTGIPYTFTAHAHDIYVERPMLDEKIREASWVATISEFNRRFLIECYGETAAEKTVVIRCGIDAEVFELRSPREPSDLWTIICIASLKDYKGHAYLLQACAQLRDLGLAFRCLLVGDGECRAQIENDIIRLGLSDYVTLLGFQPRSSVKQLLADADAMVLPSVVTETGKMEGIPVVLMEALAVGLPVVTTAISGIPELIVDRETGLLVPERDPQAITEALLELRRSPELARRMAAAGHARVIQEFNLKKNTAVLSRLLRVNWDDQTDMSPVRLSREFQHLEDQR